jgi:replicative DNA helicase Mcm
MSVATDTRTDRLRRFLGDYYRDEIAELAQRYPSEQTRLEVEFADLFQFDSEIADDWVDHPTEISGYADEALRTYDLPADVSLDGASVVLVGLDDTDTYLPNELSTDNTGYVAVRGKLGRVSSKDETATDAAFECKRCGTPNYISQSPGELQEPHECQGCERQGPFKIDDNNTEWADYCQLRIETPPDESGSPQPEHIDGYCVGDVVHTGGEYGLLGRAGESVIAYGEIERHEKDDGLFERVLRVRAVEFPDEDDNVDVEAHREDFEELAARDDAVDMLAESIAPALYQTDAWATAMEWAVTYLFAAPRIELPDGTSYRGDIHGAIISDYGMGKSMFSHGLETLSPDCIRKSATALSSDVGLTAAAVQDDFAGGKWTLKPGILVRGNGGHVILDEIDKGPDDLESINDALEGQQRVDVEKAGLSAEYNSRTGVLVMGNPQEGRFDPTQPVAPQIGVDSSLLSRFDGIITMSDNPDADIDAAIAEQIGDAYAEANQLEFGDRADDDLEALERPVPTDVAQAWIKDSRENCNPVFRKELVTDIKQWYAEEVRPMNRTYASNGDGEDMPVPATARVVMWVIRFATAFARVHQREEVAPDDIDRAESLARRLVGQNWDGEKFDPNVVEGNTSPSTQDERKERLKDALERADDPLTPAEIAERTPLSEDNVNDELEVLSRKGEVYQPQTGEYLPT